MVYFARNSIVARFTKLIVVGVSISLTLMVMLSLVPFGPTASQDCHCDKRQANDQPNGDGQVISGHKLAVIVPFRDRFDELMKFVPHISRFLTRQRINFKIYIINQVDSLRFNRASLINVGFLVSRGECDYMAMHDVDLLPLNPDLSYEYPTRGPFHVASPELHPKYHYKTFVGGILLITREQFERVNGLSNRYWGWGLEDDEFYARMKEAGLKIHRPQGIKTGINDTFQHIHDRSVRKRDTARLFNQKEVTRKRDRQTGLSSVQYELVALNHLTVDGHTCTVHHVKLNCDRSQTPWCEPFGKPGKSANSKPPPAAVAK